MRASTVTSSAGLPFLVQTFNNSANGSPTSMRIGSGRKAIM
jgi:hypothetical protein